MIDDYRILAARLRAKLDQINAAWRDHKGENMPLAHTVEIGSEVIYEAFERKDDAA